MVVGKGSGTHTVENLTLNMTVSFAFDLRVMGKARGGTKVGVKFEHPAESDWTVSVTRLASTVALEITSLCGLRF